MRRADRLRRRFRQAEEAYFPLLLQARHLADRVLDRHVWVDAVLVVEIDDVDVQPLEARLAGGPHIFRIAAHAEELAIGPAHIAELGGEEHLAAAVRDRAPDQLLILSP